MALVRAMRLAIEDAGISPDDVDVVYAAANGTIPLDRQEAAGIREVFGARDVLVTSIKGAIGEFGAAGAASCAAALLCGAAGRVPPIVGLSEPSPAAASLCLAREAMDLPGPIALVNSVASGGALFSVVVRARPVQ